MEPRSRLKRCLITLNSLSSLPAFRICVAVVDASGNLKRSGQHPLPPHCQGPQEPPREPGLASDLSGLGSQGEVTLAPFLSEAADPASVGASGAARVARVGVLATADAGDRRATAAGRGRRRSSSTGLWASLNLHIHMHSFFASPHFTPSV